ncbi:LytR/AlgR family response regulator transcription factor [Nitrincola iocasae]|uniref:Response regulator transcription factor n=1 Tax=Nitrincola iocasae TaxID=2614693 RepID=A0A5J6L9V4_9GAMM|nr:LytTR family DNA-binding domain-containing protein [Nitrincola iocasae]QEW05260.1 response regulator transcription factor [Nitrincola iocasae]
MRTLIVDDEPLARSRLKRLLLAHPDYVCVGEASNGEEAIAQVEALKPDLVLLDIEMPGSDGLSVAEQLNARQIPPAIIFVTAHPEHALDAYRVSPADYLLKPVDPERLTTALSRLGMHTRAHLERNEELNPWISYQIGNSLRRIRFEKVQYFMAEDKIVKMVFDGGEAIVEQSLKQLEQRYGQLTLRAHRNCIINKSRMIGIQKDIHSCYFAELSGTADKIEVSRRFASQLKHIYHLSDVLDR